MPDHPTYRSQVLDHLGLGAGLCDALGLGDVLDQATHPDPQRRDLSVGEAVKAMVRNGLGLINHTLSLVPRFCQKQPPSRRISPRVAPAQRNDDALGHALDTRSRSGVTTLYSRIAATAAQPLGLAPHLAHLDRTRFHVDGRSNSDDEPEAQVMHITRGDSREQRPDRNQGLLELLVAHQAGLPIVMPPLSGNSSAAQDFGAVGRAQVPQGHLPSGLTYLMADRALSRDANRQQLAQTPMQWMTRVPATLREAPAVLAPAAPKAMASLTAADRDHELPSLSGGVPPRWSLMHSAPCQPQVQRTLDRHMRQQSAPEVKALQK